MSNTDVGHSIETIFSAGEILSRLQVLAQEIAAKRPENLLVVPILKGSFVFAADLLRALHAAGIAPEVDFLTLSSYRKSRSSSGQVSILRDLDLDVQQRHVILIDDVLDFRPHPGLRKGSDFGARRSEDRNLRVARQAGRTRRLDRARLLRVHVPRRVCRRLRHGRGASL